MLLSNEEILRKFAQMLNQAFEKYNCTTNKEKYKLVEMTLMLLGQKSGDTIDTRKFSLTTDNIEILNQKIFLHNYKKVLTIILIIPSYTICTIQDIAIIPKRMVMFIL